MEKGRPVATADATTVVLSESRQIIYLADLEKVFVRFSQTAEGQTVLAEASRAPVKLGRDLVKARMRPQCRAFAVAGLLRSYSVAGTSMLTSAISTTLKINIIWSVSQQKFRLFNVVLY